MEVEEEEEKYGYDIDSIPEHVMVSFLSVYLWFSTFKQLVWDEWRVGMVTWSMTLSGNVSEDRNQ